MSRPLRRRHAPLLGLAAALVATAACSGTAKTAATSSTAASTTTSTIARTTTSSTAAPTTTATVAASTTVAPTTTVAPAPTFPFTGQPIDDPARFNRPALAVKINNAASARPQHGLNQADIVFEEKVEGITRFLAVFQSTDVPQIGSVRSARTSDLDMLSSLSHPLFVWSGGNRYVEGAVAGADLTDIGKDHHREVLWTGRVLRDYTEFFTSTERAYALTPEGQGAPKPIFAYRTPGEPIDAGGQDIAGVSLQLQGTHVEYRWNGDVHGWLRFEDGTAHKDSDGVQVAPANIVVVLTNYRASPADPKSPEAVTVGKGEVWVLSEGKLIAGTWSRADAKSGWELLDAGGKPIRLLPGRTWVELATPEGAERIEVGQ